MNDAQKPDTNKEKNHSPDVAQYRQRIQEIERQLRNMRLAIIVVVAFFIYDTLAPSGFRDRTHTLNQIETQDLRVVDERGRSWMRLGTSEGGGVLSISAPDGAQLIMEPKAVTMNPIAGQAVPRLELRPSGVQVIESYDRP